MFCNQLEFHNVQRVAPFTILSLRYSADVGRSRLVNILHFPLFSIVRLFQMTIFCLKVRFFQWPARYIVTFDVISEVNCVLFLRRFLDTKTTLWVSWPYFEFFQRSPEHVLNTLRFWAVSTAPTLDVPVWLDSWNYFLELNFFRYFLQIIEAGKVKLRFSNFHWNHFNWFQKKLLLLSSYYCWNLIASVNCLWWKFFAPHEYFYWRKTKTARNRDMSWQTQTKASVKKR